MTNAAPLITNLPIARLQLCEDNPNVMQPEEFDSLCAAMKEKGMLQPILVRELATHFPSFRVIDGHHRLKAAQACGMTDVACVVYKCSDTEEHILRLGMNRLRGEVDLTAAGRIIAELRAADVGLDEMLLTGFSESEMEDLVRSVSQNVDEEVKMNLPAEDDYEVDTPVAKPLVLELQFLTKEDLKKAKRGLRRAAGKGKDLSDGLLRLLGADEDEEAKEVA